MASYGSFYSLVSSIKDKSSQAMATLSSDLQEFKSIMQEDVAEVAKTVRKSVQEKSESLRRRSSVDTGESDATAPAKSNEASSPSFDGEDVEEEKTSADRAESADVAITETEEKQAAPQPADPQASSSALGSMFNFGGFSFEAVGTKLLDQADQLLGALAGDGTDDDGADAQASSEQRYRLLALQEDPETYTEAPMDTETFQRWREALTAEELAEVRADILAHYPTVQERLHELVPAVVSEDDFWAHYIYKASLLAAQEKRGADLLEQALNDDEEEIGWDLESPRNSVGTEEPPASGSAVDDVETVRDKAMDTARGAAPGALETMSSDGESWIELDEQQRRATPSPSTGSDVASSSQVEEEIAKMTIENEPVKREKVEDEEDVDWGDEDEEERSSHAEEEAKDSSASKDTQDVPQPSKRRSDDWGEWD